MTKGTHLNKGQSTKTKNKENVPGRVPSQRMLSLTLATLASFSNVDEERFGGLDVIRFDEEKAVRGH